ncbi:recombinase family protein [Flintibacter muris]|uniref:recombinase family protein n=1 Tax=Flintibacter muris TaxID=2941327 RepID=UPI00204137C3|nr:recombinase family protein [Flintibacter muris]
MNVIQKSEAIKNGLRKGFQDGSSKMARRKCYGYEVGPDGELTVNPDEAQVVCWIFERYLAGDSLGKIAAGLERQGLPSPTGRPKWNREAIDKLLSNEKYTGRVLLQKTLSTGAVQIENNGLMERYLYTGSHEAIISDEMFMAVQQEKLSRSKEPQNHIAMKLSL